MGMKIVLKNKECKARWICKNVDTEKCAMGSGEKECLNFR